MTIKEITGLIEEFAPLSLQESYDNAGLICGDLTAEARSALLCIDVTEEVIDEAITGGYNLIISHHPLIFHGLKNLLPDNTVKRCLLKAIQHHLNIYSAHTNMDAVAQGVSGRMADKLGLIGQHVLQPAGKLFSLSFYTPVADVEKVRQAIFNSGGGDIGNYSHCSFNSSGEGTFVARPGTHPYVGKINELHTEKEIKTEITIPDYLLSSCIQALKAAHPYEEPVWNIVCLENTNPTTGFGIIGELSEAQDSLVFMEKVKKTFGCQVIRHTAICKSKIKKVAVCGGSGAFLTGRAISLQADLFISADYKYHDFFGAENKIILADIGHYESEQFTKEIFYELVTKKIPNFVIRFSKAVTNPIHYM